MKDLRFVGENLGYNRNLKGLLLFATAIFFLLLIRLWYLQIVKVDSYVGMSESNRLRLVPVAASRGTIFDRKGKILTSNRPSYSVAAIPLEIEDKERFIRRLAQLINIPPAELRDKWEKGRRRARYFPIVLASGLTQDQLEILEENRMSLPGLDVQTYPVRDYPNGVMASHLLGYLGHMSERELEDEAYSKFNPGAYVGKSGIERNWEAELHGNDGGRQLEVDAMGRVLRTASEVIPTVGNSLVLTIDLEMQKAAEEAFGEQAGAAVALDVNTGEILAFVSKPDYDPALFAEGLTSKQWKEYLADSRHPLENKALKGQYPPGSTFKILMALAGLEEGLVDGKSAVHCNGSYTMGNRTFRCWQKRGHGNVSLKKALRESCDVYFYRLGERLGVDKIAYYAQKFGLGSPLGIGIQNEKGGLIPTMAWKEKRFGQKWLKGETISVAIGQGFVLMTPVQLAAMTAAVANEGTIFQPHLVKRIISPDGKILKEFRPEVRTRVNGIRSSSFRMVKEGLFAVVNEPGGTGGMARINEVIVSGKTGTSQVVKQHTRGGYLPYQYRDHALFVAFAPYEKPEVAVAVIVEHGEHGGSAAAPIAGRILRRYFEEKGIIKKPVVKKEAPADMEKGDTASSVSESPEGEPEDDGVADD